MDFNKRLFLRNDGMRNSTFTRAKPATYLVIIVLSALCYLLMEYKSLQSSSSYIEEDMMSLAALGNGSDDSNYNNNDDSQRRQVWVDNHAKELVCNFTYQHVDEKCPRFVYLPISETAGLGNKYFLYIVGITLSIALDATYLYEDWPFTNSTGQEHGAYPWVEEMFQLGSGESRVQETVDKYGPKTAYMPTEIPWDELIDQYNNPNATRFTSGVEGVERCDVMFYPSTAVCDQRNCFESNGPRVYERTKSIMRCKFMHGTYRYTEPLVFHKGKYNIAWHIRLGDTASGDGYQQPGLYDGETDYYQSLKDTLSILLHGFDYHIHFFTESPKLKPNEAPPGWRFLPDMFPNCSFHNHLDVPATMMHFFNADMIITAGSSFAFIPAILSYKPTVLFEQPKESLFQNRYFEIYNDADYVLMKRAKIIRQSLDEVRAKIIEKYIMYHDHIIPDHYRISSMGA